MKHWYPLSLPRISRKLIEQLSFEVDCCPVNLDVLKNDRAYKALLEVFPVVRAVTFHKLEYHVHRDGYYENVNEPPKLVGCAINYIINGSGALRWYEPAIQLKINGVGTPVYAGYRRELDSWEHAGGDWALVDIKTPHALSVFKAPRRVISFRNKDITFKQAQKLLSTLIS